MKYIQKTLEDILNEKIIYNVDNNGYQYIYNYRLEKTQHLLLTLKLSEEQFILELLMLPPELRRKHMGTHIVNELKRWAYINDYPKINLLAIQNSKEFWQKQGFVGINNSLQMSYIKK